MSKSLKRIIILPILFITIGFLIFFINQIILISSYAGNINPEFGVVTFWGLIGFFSSVLLIPVVLFIKLPATIKPPKINSEEDKKRYYSNLNKRLIKNPLLTTQSNGTLENIEDSIQQLDSLAKREILDSASQVFISTAISQYGSLDSVFMLGIQSKLIWKIAHTYSQRPSIKDMVYLYSNVFSTAFLAYKIDETTIADQLHPLIGATLGSFISLIPGTTAIVSLFVSSIIDGATNTLLTLRVGAITQQYCGNIEFKSKRNIRKSASVEAIKLLPEVIKKDSEQIYSTVKDMIKPHVMNLKKWKKTHKEDIKIIKSIKQAIS